MCDNETNKIILRSANRNDVPSDGNAFSATETGLLKYPMQIRSGAETLLFGDSKFAKEVNKDLTRFGNRLPPCRPGLAWLGTQSILVAEQQCQFSTEKEYMPSKKSKRLNIKKYVSHSHSDNAPAHMFSIVVDHRERKSNNTFFEWMKSTGVVHCVEAQLPCGDFMFADRSGGLFPAIVERKTLSDLVSSLLTSRYSQQKRLMHVLGLPHNFLLVEGLLDATSTTPPDDLKKIHSAIVSTSGIDNFHVIHNENQNGTFQSLLSIGLALTNISHSGLSLTQFIPQTLATKQLLVLKSVFPTILSNIHCCSADTACELSLEFKTMVNLHIDVLSTRQPQFELNFVKRVQKRGKRPRENAELSIKLIQLFGDFVHTS